MKTRNLIISSIVIAIAVSGCTRINVGNEGIEVQKYGTNRGVQDTPIVTGTVLYNPFFEEVYEYPIYRQTVQYKAFTLNTKEGASITVDPAITINAISGKAPIIFATYHKNFDDLVGDGEAINLALINVFRDVLNQYTMDSIISDRIGFESKVYSALQTTLNAQGFQLSQLTSGLKLPDNVVKAINDKTAAIQEAQVVDNQLSTSRALLQKAQIDAQTTQVQAAALTDLQVREDFIKKWDGHTPIYGYSPLITKQSE